MNEIFFRSKIAALTDERIKVMNEIISGMRVIKMYTWEKPFAKLVANLRRFAPIILPELIINS